MRRWRLLAQKNPSGVLLLAQLAAILAYPGIGVTTPGRMTIGVLGMLIVLIAVWRSSTCRSTSTSPTR